MAPAESTYAPGNTAPPSVEDWAFLGHLTQAQFDVLGEFRLALQANAQSKANLATKNDATLLRFLRARQFDLKKAMKMALEDLDWRQEIAGKRISGESIAQVLPFVRTRLIRLSGLDLQGRPVVVLSLNQVFPRKVSDIMEIVNFFIFYVESLKKYVEELGFTEFAAIADMKGWSLSENFSLPVVQVLAGMLQDHYPETLRYAFVVNNPFAFSAAWGLISPFLEERVKAKIHVFGKKMDKLKQYIAAENLDSEFGGTRPTPYDAPDFIMQPLDRRERVAVVPLSPHDPIGWEDELPAASAVVVKEEDAGEGLERDFETAVAVSTGDKPDATAPPTLQKKKSIRKTIARMFSSKDVPVVAASSPARSTSSLGLAPAPAASAPAETRPMEVVPPKARPRVAVFGGTGRTGRETILSLLDGNNDVSAFVRIHGSNLSADLVQRSQQQSSASSSSLTVFVGEFGSLLDLERVVEGCDAVIVAIGVPPALTAGSGAEFLPLALERILTSMHKFKVRRLVLVSSAHASQSWWDSGAGLLANVTKPVYWKNHYQYVAQMESLVIESQGKLDYTIVRPGTLLEDGAGAAASAIKIEEGFVLADSGPGEISRQQLSKFLVAEALDVKAESKYCNKGVAIGKAA